MAATRRPTRGAREASLNEPLAFGSGSELCSCGPMNTVVFTAPREPDPTFALRVRIPGQRKSVGPAGPTSARDGAGEAADRAVQPSGGPPSARAPDTPRRVPSFREFASIWLDRQMLEGGHSGSGLSDRSRQDIEWRLSKHLVPAFGEAPLDRITREAVDNFRLAMVRESGLGVTSINKLLFTLSAVLETAVEYEIIARNGARGRRRRLAAPAPKRPWLDRADHIAALLEAAGRMDHQARVHRGQRRSILATLAFAGLRIGEALSLRWREVDLIRDTITIRASKTEAGLRTVNMLPILRAELAGYRASQDSAPDSLVFGTSNGRENGATNIRRRILAKAVEGANERLLAEDADPLPDHLTPHALRRTFASLLFAIGESPPYVMAQMGHTTPSLTLAIYARQMNRRDGEPDRLKALVGGHSLDRAARDDSLR
jgi:integrase